MQEMELENCPCSTFISSISFSFNLLARLFMRLFAYLLITFTLFFPPNCPVMSLVVHHH